jgi:hypothetical protein
MLAKFVGGPHDGERREYYGSAGIVNGIDFLDGSCYDVVNRTGEIIVLQFTHSLKEKFARRNADREPVSYQGEGVGTDSPRNN